MLENIEFYPAKTACSLHRYPYNRRFTSMPFPQEDGSCSSVLHGRYPKSIFLPTCDAIGIPPSISKLTPGQVMYHYVGYTAQVAGIEPESMSLKPLFLPAEDPFSPLLSTKYAKFLGCKFKGRGANV